MRIRSVIGERGEQDHFIQSIEEFGIEKRASLPRRTIFLHFAWDALDISAAEKPMFAALLEEAGPRGSRS